MQSPKKLNCQIQSYLENLYAEEDEALIATRESSARLKGIPITPLIGKTLSILSQILGAKRILEIGTLVGYSTIWLARSLSSGGEVVSIEVNPDHFDFAAKNLSKAGLDGTVKLMLGSANDKLAELQKEQFDMIFLDADKEGYPEYLEPMISLLQPGGLLIADNLVRLGRVIDPLPKDVPAQALSRFNQMIASHPRLESVVLPTLVGYVGGDLDGLSISRLTH